MKRLFGVVISLSMIFLLMGCTFEISKNKDTDNGSFEWTRTGYFQDDNMNTLYIDESQLDEYPGWFVGLYNTSEMHGWYIEQVGETLYGDLTAEGEDGEFIVTVSEEGEDGVLVEVENGDTYHCKPQDETALAEGYSVTLNIDGMGEVAYMEGTEAQFTDDDYYQSSQINIDEPATYTLSARTLDEGWSFVKWTKDGEDYAAEPTVTYDVDGSADFVAVFEFFDGNVEYDYGESDIYTQEDMDSAINVILDEFDTWEGYELHNVRYISDDCADDIYLEWLNGNENNYTECIEFVTDFRTPLEDTEVVSANCIYKDWEWWLAREDGGQWELVSYGY